MKKNKVILIPIMLFLLVLMMNCFKTNQDIVLNENLSGTITLKVAYNIDSVVDAVISMEMRKNKKRKKSKKITPEKIEKAKKEMKENISKQGMKSMKPLSKEEIQKQLPKGVKVVLVKMNEAGTESTLKFEFKHISNLKKIKNISLKAKGKKKKSGTKMSSPLDSNPFQKMKIKKSGKYLIFEQMISTTKKEKKKKKSKPMKGMKGIKKLMKDLTKDVSLKYSFKVPTAKYKVVKHNAHKYNKSNGVLSWNYDIKKLKRLERVRASKRKIYIKLKTK